MKVAKISSLVLLPLALCAAVPETSSNTNAIADAAIVEKWKIKTGLLAIAGVTEEISGFFKYANRIADDALSKYEGKNDYQNWPNSVEELIKLMDTRITTGREEITALSSNPFQDFINGVSNGFNGISSAVSNGINNVTDAISGATNQTSNNTILGTNSTTPFSGVLGGITNGIGNLTSEITRGNLSNINPPGLIGGITNGLGNLTSEITGGNSTNKTITTFKGGLGNSSSDPFSSGLENSHSSVTHGNFSEEISSFLSSLTNNTGKILEGLSGIPIGINVLGGVLSLLGDAVANIFGENSLDSNVLGKILEVIVKNIGSNNELEDFISAIKNLGGSDATILDVLKVPALVYTVSNVITFLVKVIFEFLTKNIKNGVESSIFDIFGKLFSGGLFSLQRLQAMTGEEAALSKEYLLAAIKAQVSPAVIAYFESFAGALHQMVQEVFAKDPIALSALTDPSEDNIRRLVITVAKVVTEQK